MIAKLTTQNDNARNMGQEKETVDTINIIALHKGEMYNCITARFYMGRSASASTVYCSVWINKRGIRQPDGSYSPSFHTSGRGSAGGYGYHKASAALGEALGSAGVLLFGSPYRRDEDKALSAKDRKRPAHIGGCGSTAMEEALKAVAVALGYRGKLLIVKN